MTNYSKIREAVKMARKLNAESRRMKASNPQGAKDRSREGDLWMTRALMLAGRV